MPSNYIKNASQIMGNSNNTFTELLNEGKKAVKEQSMQRDIRREYGNRITLHDITERCEDLSKVFSQKGMEKCPLKEKAYIIAQTIIKAADGNILCENFNSNDKMKQRIHVYDGTHWSLVEGQRYGDFCKDAAAHCNIDDSLYNDPDFMKFVNEKLAFIVAHELPPIIHPDEEWINLQNGTLVIDREGNATLRDHCREDYFFHVLPYNYDPAAECPRFQSFLDQMIPEREAQMMLAEYIAYCFTKGIKLEKMLVLLGDGSNGKSVVLDIIKAIMGEENVSEIPLDELTQDEEKRVMLEHKLLNISRESRKDIDASTLKTMVSGEPLIGRILYQGTVTIRDYGKNIASFNKNLKAEQTNGFYRRLIILPMKVTITKKEEIRNYQDTIIAEELPGILNWVLEGMKRFIDSGYKLTESPMCEAALEEYKSDTNSVISFFNDCCTPCDDYAQKGKDIYKAYAKYCEEEELAKPLGQKKFYKQFCKLDTKPHTYQGAQMFKVKYKERA